MTNKINKETLKENIVSEFGRYEDSLNGGKDSKLHRHRKEAVSFIKAAGFPTKKHEQWRYANLSFLNGHDFRILPEPSAISSSGQSKTDLPDNIFTTIPNIKDSIRLVFINGCFSGEYSDLPEAGGLTILPLSGVINSDSINSDSINSDSIDSDSNKSGAIRPADAIAGKVIDIFSSERDYKNNPFLALNNSLAMDGAVIIVADNANIDKPIHLIYINDSRHEPVLAQQRNYFSFGDNSHANIIETYHTMGENTGFTNIATDILLGENAVLNTHKFQDDSELSHLVCSADISQQAGSVYNDFAVTLSGGFVRNNLNSVLKGRNAEANFNGLYFINDDNYVDNHTLTDHAVPNCNSNELYKGIIGGGATAVFSGKILVRKDAQKTAAYQSNKNILLTDRATINTKPQLEIYADDVKCSHGATSGNLDCDELFYLRTRGIGEDKARALLLGGFAGEVINKIKIKQLRDIIENEVSARLLL